MADRRPLPYASVRLARRVPPAPDGRSPRCLCRSPRRTLRRLWRR